VLKRILVPLDGSERAERGLALAARLARGAGGGLLLVRIVSVPPMRFAPYGEPAQIALALIAQARDNANNYLKNVAKRLPLRGFSVETRTVEGHVTADILDIARDEKCGMIVICTHGSSGFNRWRLGRVAAQVARHAPVPVLIVPARDAQPSGAEAIGDRDTRILIALDGSELAEAAITPALDVVRALATPERITVHLLEVVDFFAAVMADATRQDTPSTPAIGVEEQALLAARDYLEMVAQRIRGEHPGITVLSTPMLASDVAETIIMVAEGVPRYDVIAMATHGRGGPQRWAMGSITERVLHATHLPLIIARSADAIEHDRQVAAAKAEAELHR
jgi:nucleotide-binding universal stress UspA family protein